MKQTVLHSQHLRSGAVMTEFQGWRVPAQFSGIDHEYHAVRTAAGLFDVGFLGRIEIAGEGAQTTLQRLFTRNLDELADGTAVYGLFCNDQGGIIDAALLFRQPGAKKEPKFLVTVNAVTTDRIIELIRRAAGGDVLVTDRTTETAQLALQGPHADGILESVADTSFKRLKHRKMKDMRIAGVSVLVSRTGLTGERGFELFFPAERADRIWNLLLESGKDRGVLPCGMTCREMLRVEAGYALTGADLDETRNPVDAGLLHVVDLSAPFAARDAIARLKAEGPRRTLVAFELFEKGVPRPGGTIFSEIKEIGVVTSGVHSIARRRDVGLGYVLARYRQPGQEIEVEIKDRETTAKIIALPLYRKK